MEISWLLLWFNTPFKQFCLFPYEHNLNHYSVIFESKFFVLIKDNWSWIHSHTFVITFLSAYHEHFSLNYVFSDPLIPSILILPLPGALMNLPIITLCVNVNTYNIHIVFAHLYYLLHPSVVSYIITYFMNKLFSYIQWMNYFIC